ncbi:MAG: anion permease [Myxococcales bacterium]|nr:anion permease [Myxococcales bacterium]
MTFEQLTLAALLLATLVLFVWSRFRHDVVAIGALVTAVALGLVPGDDAFAGLSHPAVVTVAAVLVLSHALQTSGAVDVLARRVLPESTGPWISIGALTALGALLSGFMNNVGALALLMPLGVQLATRLKLAPGQVLMPLAFGTILGGMTTLVGTPPNLIVSGFRASAGLGPYGMFDFTTVGVVVAGLGVLVVALGWRLVPRRDAGSAGFAIEAYLTELRVLEGSELAGLRLDEVDAKLDPHEAEAAGLVQNEIRIVAPHPSRRVRVGDILIVRADAEALGKVLGALDLKLEEAVRPADAEPELDTDASTARSSAATDDSSTADESRRIGMEVAIVELVVLPQSSLIGRTATDIELRTRYGINLLAISRRGHRALRRLRATRFRAGDVLLLQGSAEAIRELAVSAGCVPLAERALTLPSRRRALLASTIMLGAVAAATFGAPAAIAFTAAVVVSVVVGTVALRQLYLAIDGSVVVLLAGLIPVAGAMETTGMGELVAHAVLEHVAGDDAVIALVAVLTVTALLSAVVNNAATAAVMLPIALGTAQQLDVRPDAFLMAVAVGASCAFLTPISHQNNTLILGPGGFRFGDYWRLGLVVQLLVLAVAPPMLLWIWPL